VGSGGWGCRSVVRICRLMRTQHFRICTSLVCGVNDSRQRARICVCGSVRFRPEQICAVTDLVSEQQRSVCSISIHIPSRVQSVAVRVSVCLFVCLCLFVCPLFTSIFEVSAATGRHAQCRASKRYGHSYYGILIGTRMRFIEWRYFQ